MSEPPPAASPESVDGHVDPQHPWPGLLAFKEADRDFFFGRDAEADELLALVVNHRVTVLFGLSGLGKTSLLGAGLFPRLRQRDFLPVHLRIDVHAADDPSAQITSALVKECRRSQVDAPPPLATDSIWEHLHRSGVDLFSPRNRLLTPVLVFDQFEEIFSRTSRDAAGAQRRAQIVDAVADLAEGRVPDAVKRLLEENPSRAETLNFDSHRYHLLITLREDYLPNLEELVPEMPSLRRSRMRLTHMRGDLAAHAVLAAGREAAIVTPDVALGIVRFVGESAATHTRGELPLSDLSIEPALLSVVCRELNEQRIHKQAPTIVLSQLETGEDILRNFLEDAMKDSPEPLWVALEQRFITADGTREMVAYQTLAAVAGVSETDIQRLVDRRILRTEYREGRRLLELTHDRLTPVIRENRIRREQHDEQERARRQQLAQVEARSARIFRRLTIGLAAALIVLVVAVVFAVIQSMRVANEARAAQQSERLAREATLEAVEASKRADDQRRLALDLRERAETSEADARALAAKAEQAAAAADRERRAALTAREEALAAQRLAEAAAADAKRALDESTQERLKNAELASENRQQTALVESFKEATQVSNAPPRPVTPSAVGLRLRVSDVFGEPVRTPMTITGSRVSDNRSLFTYAVASAPSEIVLRGVPAGGPYLLDVSARGYQSASQYVTVRGASDTTVTLTLPLNPKEVRQVAFTPFDGLRPESRRILDSSTAVDGFPGQSGPALYAAMSDLQRAALLNLLALAGNIGLSDGRTVLSSVQRLTSIRENDLRAVVDSSLPATVAAGMFRSVPSALRRPPPGFVSAGSWKSADTIVTLQVSFSASNSPPISMIADMDIDTNGGLTRTFQVARGTYTAIEHPYDVHQLLVFLMKLDPQYKPLP